MTTYSTQWLETVARPRSRSWQLPLGATEPLLPWITPEVPPALKALFQAEGVAREFAPGEYIYTPSMPLTLMTLVVNGVAGRAFGSMYNQAKQGMALAVADRICGGNHTFFSGRPGNGRYFAVTPLKVLILPNARIKEVMREDLSFARQMQVQLECCIQSDRIGLAANSVLPVQQRIGLYFLSWAFAYGQLEMFDDKEWVKFDAILPQTQIARVVSASLIHIKRGFAELKAADDIRSDAGTTWLKSSVLDPLWQWLCSNEEPLSDMPRPKDWRQFLKN
ncbi:MAG: hypothetical protein Q4E62_06235 [Sutterellaceae bacterium]|nr:hypothetical protein [Sutterellaceae bacterium]